MGTYWGRQAFLKAKTMCGAPYVFGGNLPPLGNDKGTDCSGLVQWAYHENGITLPRTTFEQYKVDPVTDSYWNGDLLFFTGSDPGPDGEPGHVGLFAGFGVISANRHDWTGSGLAVSGKMIVLNAPFTGDVGGIRFDYVDTIGEVIAHTRPGNLRADPPKPKR